MPSREVVHKHRRIPPNGLLLGCMCFHKTRYPKLCRVSIDADEDDEDADAMKMHRSSIPIPIGLRFPMRDAIPFVFQRKGDAQASLGCTRCDAAVNLSRWKSIASVRRMGWRRKDERNETHLI